MLFTIFSLIICQSMAGPIYLPDLGSLLIEQPPVIVDSVPWIHTFKIAIPCVNNSNAELVASSVEEAVSRGNELVTEWKEMMETRVKDKVNTSVDCVLETLVSNVQSTVEKLKERAKDMKGFVKELNTHGYYLNGLLNSSICLENHIGEKYTRVRRDNQINFYSGSAPAIKVNSVHGIKGSDNPDLGFDDTTDRVRSPIHTTESTRARTSEHDISQPTGHRRNGNDYMMVVQEREQPTSGMQQSQQYKSPSEDLMRMYPSTQSVQKPAGFRIVSWECLMFGDEKLSCEETSVKPIDTKHVSTYLRHPRKRRGLVNPIGHVYKWIYGTMDSEDRKMISAAIANLQRQTTSTRDYMISSERKFLSFATEVDETVHRYHQAITKRFGIIGDNIQRIKAYRSQVTSKIAEQSRMMFAIGQATAVSLSTTNILDALSVSMAHFLEIQTYLTSVQNAVTTGVASPHLVSPGMILAMLKSITTDIKGKYRLPVMSGLHDWYKDAVMTPYIQGKNLMVSVTSPLLPESSPNMSYLVRSLPFKAGDSWLEYPYDNYLIQHSLDKKFWYLIPPQDKQLCIGNPFQLCPGYIPTYTQDPTSCLGSLITDSSSYPDTCQLRHKGDVVPMVPVSIKVKHGVWLVSTPSNTTMASLVCYLPNNITDKSIKMIGSISLMSVPEECEAHVGPLLLDARSHAHLRTNSNASLGIYNKIPRNLSSDWFVSDHKSYVNDMIVDLSRDPLVDPRTIAFPKSVIRIKDLTQKISKDRNTYLNEMDALSTQLSVLKKRLSVDLGWRDLLGEFRPDITSTVALVGVIICIGGLFYLSFRIRSPYPAMVAMSHKAPGTWAAVIKQTTTSQKPINQTSLILTMSDTLYQQATINHIMTFIMGCVMISLMMLCHCWVKKFISSKFDKIASLMGLVWKNREAQHNPGECKFIAYFLFQISCKYPGKRYTVEVPIQICTLPLNVSDWYLKEPVVYDRWIEGDVKIISGRYLSFSLVWSPDTVCVKSKHSTTLETCNDMPKAVRVAKWYVEQDAPLPWWALCKRYQIAGVSRIVLEKHGVFSEMYHYRI